MLDPEYVLSDEEIIRLAQKIQIPFPPSEATTCSHFNEFIFESENASIVRLISINAYDMEKIFAKNCKYAHLFSDIAGIIICLPFSYYDEHFEKKFRENAGINLIYKA